jgi:hypothetical protein
MRFGFLFEGIFRQHAIVKGKNRDTAWFALLDCDWRTRERRVYELWLEETNFDCEGKQIETMAGIRSRVSLETEAEAAEGKKGAGI